MFIANQLRVIKKAPAERNIYSNNYDKTKKAPVERYIDFYLIVKCHPDGA
jgi:hypothetical protein